MSLFFPPHTSIASHIAYRNTIILCIKFFRQYFCATAREFPSSLTIFFQKKKHWDNANILLSILVTSEKEVIGGETMKNQQVSVVALVFQIN